ncbi:TPA: hypothetical protein QEL30_003497 [Stenotrophomonas maltophilia]|nr:hypothetical protein [Stenotrophomonas maltophilia]
MPFRPKEFTRAAHCLLPHLRGLPGKLVAIDGKPGTGKTTLGRFLAWYFNVSLVETDLFLAEPALTKGATGLNYELSAIRQIIDSRLQKPRPVIVEGVAVLRTLQQVGRTPDLLIYVSNSSASDGRLGTMLRRYDAEFSPASRADVKVSLSH